MKFLKLQNCTQMLKTVGKYCKTPYLYLYKLQKKGK